MMGDTRRPVGLQKRKEGLVAVLVSELGGADTSSSGALDRSPAGTCLGRCIEVGDCV